MSSKLLNYPSTNNNPHAHLVSSTTSHGGGGPAGATVKSSLNYENLQLTDILCTVCQSVLVEPVFLPCEHRFCRNCLSGTIEKNNLNCPCCRKRFGTWYRNASRVNKLVHEQLWQAIQIQFREYLDDDGNGNGCNGSAPLQTALDKCYIAPTERVMRISNRGEIHKEYQSELRRYQTELLQEKKKELVASENYIINLYKQEGIIDLADSSDHLSISSTTSPDIQETTEQSYVDSAVSDAGPSLQNVGHLDDDHKLINVPTQSTVTANRPGTSKSNGSIISISSTSSASTASSSCISSASSRYSLIKSVAQQINRGTELIKQKVQSTILNKFSPGRAPHPPKRLRIADLNNSELCVKPTKAHRVCGNNPPSDDEVDDADSLKSELNHFKPILSTLSKNSTTPMAVIRVPFIRMNPLSVPSTNAFSPTKSPFKPLDPSTERRSAFSVVRSALFTPPRESNDGNTSGDEEHPVAASRPVNNRAKKNLKRSLAKARKSSRNDTNTGRTLRVTRSTVVQDLPNQMKEIIVSDQQRREAMIEQERRDFEFAQKLQSKLNGGGLPEVRSKHLRQTAYALRGSRPAMAATVKLPNVKLPPATVRNTRKRKATSSSVENEVPSNVSPSHGGHGTERRQPKRSANGHGTQRPTAQRKSSRNKN